MQRVKEHFEGRAISCPKCGSEDLSYSPGSVAPDYSHVVPPSWTCLSCGTNIQTKTLLLWEDTGAPIDDELALEAINAMETLLRDVPHDAGRVFTLLCILAHSAYRAGFDEGCLAQTDLIKRVNASFEMLKQTPGDLRCQGCGKSMPDDPLSSLLPLCQECQEAKGKEASSG